ncbi:MAG: cytochrome P450, partial [Halocynthiibacter sp.]
MVDAAEACVARLYARVEIGQGTPIEIEEETSHAAADVIFRTLFSIPIEHEIAREVFTRFRDYQRSQPILNIAAFIPLPRWMPRLFRKDTRQAAADIRGLITQLTTERMDAISAGTAPDDLATKIMTTTDPQTGDKFSTEEMVDQVAIFFLAGHETSASALAWTLYLMALYPDWQKQIAEEASDLDSPEFSALSRLRVSRDVFRESLRLYPPVPMMVRQNTCPEHFRDRDIAPGAQVVISPWHLHRHERLWDNPDGFDPTRWNTENGRQCMRNAWIPFSAGSRVCTGAGFAMAEGPLLLSMILKNFRITAVQGKDPVPVAHLTVRSAEGIWLRLEKR